MTTPQELQWAVMNEEARDDFRFRLTLRLLNMGEERVLRYFKAKTSEPGADPLYPATLYWVQLEIITGIGFSSGLTQLKGQSFAQVKRDLQAQGIEFQAPAPLQKWVNALIKKWSFTKEEP